MDYCQVMLRWPNGHLVMWFSSNSQLCMEDDGGNGGGDKS